MGLPYVLTNGAFVKNFFEEPWGFLNIGLR
jgi:hypothetical protein